MNAVAWTAPIALPLVAAGLAMVVAGRWRAWLAVIAPLPALLLAVGAPPGPAPDLSWVLLDVRLDLDPAMRVLLAATGVVWLASGVAARRLVATHRPAAALWLVTLGGNVGLVMAADVVSLYGLYAIMTFAAYGLVVHDATAVARRAGRVYVTMAVVGEALLISGLVLAAGAAGSTGITDVASAVAEAAHRDLIVALLTTGFAIKAGVIPVHVWLPLAHPAAPVPASAALSGAIIKAGLVGWLKLLPLGVVALPTWSTTFIVVGLLTAFAGAALGIAQDRAKVVLAYSSISQMGFITTLVGVGLAAPSAAPVAIAAAVTYALHHGVAKGALFLGVGVSSVLTGARGRTIVLAGTVVAGLALAGAPLSSGWVAKAAMKDAIDASAVPWMGRLTLLLSLAAIGTTLLLARLLALLARPAVPTGGSPPRPRPEGDGGGTQRDRALVAGWGGLLGATVVMSWFLPSWLLDEVPRPTVAWSTIVDGVWPVVVGLAIVALAMALRRRGQRPHGVTLMGSHLGSPSVPPGDVVVLAEAMAPAVRRAGGRVVTAVVAARDHLGAAVDTVERGVRPGAGFARLDRALTRWRAAGLLFVLLGVAMIVTMARATG